MKYTNKSICSHTVAFMYFHFVTSTHTYHLSASLISSTGSSLESSLDSSLTKGTEASGWNLDLDEPSQDCVCGRVLSMFAGYNLQLILNFAQMKLDVAKVKSYFAL